jgi:RNA polymerase sigma-54 factor
MIRQGLSQKMLQKLSPQQIQLMKLLQIPADQLEERIKEELEDNPALEEGISGDDFESSTSIDDYYLEEESSSYKTKIEGVNSDEDQKTIPIPITMSFHDYLEQQLGLIGTLDEKQLAISLQIIGSIDEDGYLRREIPSIIDDLIFSQNIVAEESEILDMLTIIQNFDPPGTGAKDLQECLLIQINIQLQNEKNLDDEELKNLKLAQTILTSFFEEFTKKHYDKLVKVLDIPEKSLKNALDEILKLNPKPASGYSGSHASNIVQYITPDFFIHNVDGQLELSLNSRNAPDLYINDHYKEMLRTAKKEKSSTTKKDKEALLFVKQKIESAKWFIDAIKQRQDTLFRTMYAILQYQYEYFNSGDAKKLRPMILKDIADLTGLDISTISRVVNSKYVQTEFGTKKLKDFFSESMQTDSGEEVSTLEVKKILKDLIEAEDKKKPLSDEKLMEMLVDKGYNIARRTVAKYREQLNLPVARLRKAL